MTDHPVDGLPTPDPDIGPAEAVRIQLTALADNDDPHPNAGIETAYNFASAANRRSTGPLDRFARMVTGPTYRPMVDHVEASRGPLGRDGETAAQRVTLTGPEGRTVTYRFGLGIETEGPFDGCWTTDAVRLVE